MDKLKKLLALRVQKELQHLSSLQNKPNDEKDQTDQDALDILIYKTKVLEKENRWMTHVITMRRRVALALIVFLFVYLSVVIVMTILSFKAEPEHKFSDTILSIMWGGSFVQVIGVIAFIVKGLFPLEKIEQS